MTGALSAARARIANAAGLHLVTAVAQGPVRTGNGVLSGTMLGVKDNIAVEGLPWTAGFAFWRERIARQDAAAVAMLRAAGAVPFAMLNMEEGALGATTNNPHFGRAGNPLDPARTTGGSSGGSAGAVAARLVDLALGTDTLGSVRIPAAYCGIVGFKPERDAVPRDGLAFLSPHFDTIGPMARRVGAVAAAARVLIAESGDAPAIRTLGIPRQLRDVELEPAVASAFERARAALEGIVRIVDVDLPGWQPGPCRRAALKIVEAEGAVALAEPLAHPDGLSKTLRGLLEYGAGLSPDAVREAHARVAGASDAALSALSADVDGFLMPTAPQVAFLHAAPVPANQADLTSLANLADLPAIALPVPGDPLPGSVQLIGSRGSSFALLALAQTAEERLAEAR